MQSHLLILFFLLSGIAPSLFALQIELKTGLKAEPKGSLISKPTVKPLKTPSPAQPQPQVETSTQPVFKQVRVAPYTHLYAEVGAKKRGQLKQGVRLKVIGSAISADGKEWSKIKFKGRLGYVKSSHLKDVD